MRTLTVSKSLTLSGAFLAVFALHLVIENHLDRLNAFCVDNVLFDADPDSRLAVIAHNWYLGLTLHHPNLPYFFSPPIRLLANVLRQLRLTDRPEPELRRRIAMFVAPAASATKALLVIVLLRTMGASMANVALLSLLSVASFSQLLFGSIPDSYALSACCIAIVYVLAADAIQKRGQILWKAWCLISVVATGITITNFATVAAVFGSVLLFTGHSLRQTLRHVVILASVTVVTTTILAACGNYAFKTRPNLDLVDAVASYLHLDPTDRAFRFPIALGDTFSPPNPSIQYAKHFSGIDKCVLRFTLSETSGGNIVVYVLRAATLMLIVVGAFVAVAAPTEMRPIYLASIVILLINWGLHTFWGSELFLYSQHWHLSGLMLIYSAVCWLRPSRLWSTVMAVYLCAVVGNNLIVGNGIVRALVEKPIAVSCSTSQPIPCSD